MDAVKSTGDLDLEVAHDQILQEYNEYLEQGLQKAYGCSEIIIRKSQS